MTSLYEALYDVAGRIDKDRRVLWSYADADEIGGYHPDQSQAKWPVGSMWAVEGKFLHAIVGALNPQCVLELGTYHGCSATHIAAALKANGSGELVCVDNGADNHRLPYIGHLIPAEYHDVITLVNADMVAYLQDAEPNSFDLIFEDGMHSPADMHGVWSQIPRVLKPGGVALSHDAMHPLVGADVRQGITNAGITNVQTYLIEPADCGYAVWVKPVEVEETSAKRKPKAKK